MSSQSIGRVTTGRTKKSVEVFWNSSDRNVYVGYAGKTNVGKASSASEAMNKAEAFLYDK